MGTGRPARRASSASRRRSRVPGTATSVPSAASTRRGPSSSIRRGADAGRGTDTGTACHPHPRVDPVSRRRARTAPPRPSPARARPPRPAPSPVLGDHVAQGPVHVPGHPRGVAAHVEVGALVDPPPQLPALPAHPVLDVDLLRLVAGERQAQAREGPVLAPGLELLAVVPVGRRTALAEEQPVPAAPTVGAALLEESPERCDARPRADHDDGHAGIGRGPEGRAGLHEHPQVLPVGAVGQERGADPVPDGVAEPDDRHRQLHLVGWASGAEEIEYCRGCRGRRRLRHSTVRPAPGTPAARPPSAVPSTSRR